ncbi:MAG: alkaline phosphatase family protein [Verrucomicrobiota bacterium]
MPFLLHKGKGVSRLLLLLLAAVFSTPAEARITHVIHVSVDGLRGDFLRALVQEPGSQYFGFNRLEREGAVSYNARCDYSHSITIPNHTSMLTCRPVLAEAPLPPEIQHGYTTNYTIVTDLIQVQGLPEGYKASAFDRVHDRGLRTALLLSKEKMRIFARSWGPDYGAPDTEGADNGRNKIDLVEINEGNTSPLISRLVAEMDRDFPAYTFLHLCDPDYAGHGSGWTSLNWRTAVKGADAQLSVIMAALDQRPELKASTALILSADHGGGSPDYTHLDEEKIENITIPLILWGPGIPGGVDPHTLFSNRTDPGPERISNTNPDQPLRNADTGNIAMALLGLPPVTGSFHRPAFAPHLEILRYLPGQPPDSVTVRWPAYLTGWKLQRSATLNDQDWRDVPESPPGAPQKPCSHTESTLPNSRQFFRLVPPD